MRLRRSTLSATMRVSWRCAASVASSASSAHWSRDGRQRVADPCAMPADTRPIAQRASLAAARLHVAQVLEEQHAEVFVRLRRLMARKRTLHAQRAGGVRSNASVTSRPPPASSIRQRPASTVRGSPRQASTPRSWNPPGGSAPVGASRRRAAGLAAHAAAPVDHQGCRPASPRSPAGSAPPCWRRHLHVAARAELLARQAAPRARQPAR